LLAIYVQNKKTERNECAYELHSLAKSRGELAACTQYGEVDHRYVSRGLVCLQSLVKLSVTTIRRTEQCELWTNAVYETAKTVKDKILSCEFCTLLVMQTFDFARHMCNG